MLDRTVDQTSYRLVCAALRDILHQATQVSPGAVDGVGSVLYRVSSVLYLLLLDHPVDQRGRCRSCRRPGAMITLRRRPCLIHLRASYWLLRQPEQVQDSGWPPVETPVQSAPGGQPDPPPRSRGSRVARG